jgi:tetratricopeptide (TPR) repeat protein
MASAQRLRAAPQASQLHLACVLSDLGHGQRQLGETAQASDFYRQALAGFEAALGDDHSLYRVAASNLAAVDLDLGRFEAVLAAYASHQAWFDERFQKGLSSGGVWSTMELNRLRALNRLGHHAQALAFADSLPVALPGSKEHNIQWWRPRVEAERALALLGLRRRAEGAERLREAIARLEARTDAKAELATYLVALQDASRLQVVQRRR